MILKKQRKKCHQLTLKLSILPLFLFMDKVSAACSIENYFAIDFRTVTVANTINTGDVIKERNIPYYFHCDPNSERSDIEQFNDTSSTGYISFYLEGNSSKLFSGINTRITVTDHTGKKHIITSDPQSNQIYYITDADLKNGFDWTYDVQVDLIRSEEPLSTELIVHTNYKTIGHFGANKNRNRLVNDGQLYISGTYLKMLNQCNVTMPSSVTLPMISISDLQNLSLYTPFALTDFNIDILCEENVSTSIAFYDVYNHGKSGGILGARYLSATSGSSVKGINFALYYNNQPLNLSYQYYRDPNQKYQNPVIYTGGDTVTQYTPKNNVTVFHFQVAYIKTSPNIFGGTLGGLATVEILYN